MRRASSRVSVRTFSRVYNYTLFYILGIFTDEALPNFIQDQLIAGSETTAHTLAWAYLYMAEHEDIQLKCYQEIESVSGVHTRITIICTRFAFVMQVLGERLPTMADRPRLPYVDATIAEIMRIRTIGIQPFLLTL